MPLISSASQLVVRWQELRALGRTASAEELCAGCPEMLDEVKRQIQGLLSMEDFLASTSAKQHAEEGEFAAGTFLGGYRINGRLGAGGMGIVFRAEDARLGRPVALKVMRPSLASNTAARQRFLREARAMAAVRHTHVATIYQVGEDGGTPFLAMELLEGESLQNRLTRLGILPTAEILALALALAEGLAAAHQRGVIHRDVKPANVWLERGVTTDGIKILDFGLARSLGAGEDLVTSNGAILGTPAYMAPEQARGELVDHRADQFSLGALLFRASTGQLPFTGPNAMAVLFAVATVTPSSPRALNPNVPQALSDLIDRLMSKDPAMRPHSAAEVAAAVKQIMKEEQADKLGPENEIPVAASGTGDQPTQLFLASPVKAGRGRGVLLVALGLLLALVPLGGWLASVILRVESRNGTLIVKIDDPETEARIKNGKLILTGPDGKVRYTLAPSERTREIEAGPYKIGVEGADGLTLDTPEFTLRKEGKVTVHVTLVPPALMEADAVPVKVAPSVPKGLAPDRRAAKWVLSIGGIVEVACPEQRVIKAIADLPTGPFRLTLVDLQQNNQVNDTGLACFMDCKNLTYLNLQNTQVGDPGLAHFKDCKHLMSLNLWGTRLSDAGLAHFKNCKSLVELDLSVTQVTNAGLAHFKDCKNLMNLSLVNTQISDAGLAQLKDYNNLCALALDYTRTTDAGLVHLTRLLPIVEVGRTRNKSRGEKRKQAEGRVGAHRERRQRVCFRLFFSDTTSLARDSLC